MKDNVCTVEWARLVYSEVEHSFGNSPVSAKDLLQRIGDHLFNDPDGPHMNDSTFRRAHHMIKAAQPLLVLQIGVFVGYQAIQLAGVMTKPDAHYVCFELDPDFANVARLFISLAGMTLQIEVLVGDESEVMSQFLAHFAASGQKEKPVIEYIVLNHWKHIYLPDLITLEHMGFINDRTIVICDNLVFPGLHGLLESENADDEAGLTFGDTSHDSHDSHDSDGYHDLESSVSQCSYDSLTALKGRHFISRWDAHGSSSHD